MGVGRVLTGKRGLNIGCKLCVMWDTESQGCEEGRDPKPLFSAQKQSLAVA